MQHSRDNARTKFITAGGSAAGVYDYDVGDIAAGEWLNFTRTFPAGAYEVYLRQALVNMVSGESVLELVTGDPTQPDPATQLLGSFLGALTGFQYRNFPLTDGSGQNKIVLRLSGRATLRLRQVTPAAADGARYQNYLIFVPAADPGVQRATISALSPAPGSTTPTVTPVIRVEIQNRDTSVRPETIRLELNGQNVLPVVTSDTNGAVATYAISPLPPSGATNIARVTFQDNLDVALTNEWSFVISYNALDPSRARPGPGSERGFRVRVVQAPIGSALANDLQRAEDQLAPNSIYQVYYDTNAVEQLINQAQDDRESGFFPGETLVPGLEPDINGTDDFAVEITTWLELAAGTHRFGVVTDDGYKISSGSLPSDKVPVLAFHNGGPANETFDFVVSAPGLYPFRMVWYERGGNAYAEWFSVDLASGERILINDSANTKAIEAFLDAAAGPAIQLESAAAVAGPFAAEAGAVIDQGARTIRIGRAGDTRFYRLRLGGSSNQTVRISSVRLEGADLVLNYQMTSP